MNTAGWLGLGVGIGACIYLAAHLLGMQVHREPKTPPHDASTCATCINEESGL